MENRQDEEQLNGVCSLQASLGGSLTRQGQIQAFLRIREKDAGPLDFDSPGGVDTTWHRIYLCLRSGFYKEAVEVSCPLCKILTHSSTANRLAVP